MGNPVITRLGLNQFWYKHWYADTVYSKTIKEDNSLKHFVNFYLNYGAEFKSNPFIHEYWYKKTFKQVRTNNQTIKNLQSFRRYFYTNDRLGIEHSYFIRYKTGEYFPMRLWVMRYGGWIFISVHWFKPVKIKSPNKYQNKQKLIGAVSRSSSTNQTNNRFFLTKSWITSNLYKNLNYTF